MVKLGARDNCLAEIGRFYRCYSRFCKSPDPDLIREVIGSAYSLNDKVRKAGYPDFFKCDEFMAIKAIRNYAIHQAEIFNKTMALPLVSFVPIEADLHFLCLLPKTVVESMSEKGNSTTTPAITKTCVFYKKYVDIYPCIYNFGVQVFLYTEKNKLEIDSEEYLEKKKWTEYERKNGYPLFVVGGFKLPHGGDIDYLLDNNLISIKEKLLITRKID